MGRTGRSLHLLEVRQHPRPVEGHFGRRVEPEIAKPRLAEHARAPVLLEARRRRRPGMEVDGAVGIFQQVYARGSG
jgi:hypothetical protein